MTEIIFVLCAIMSLACAIALFCGYKKSGNQLLFWSALCFVFLAIDNSFLCVDLIVFPSLPLNGPFWRNLLTAISGTLLVTGLISELS